MTTKEVMDENCLLTNEECQKILEKSVNFSVKLDTYKISKFTDEVFPGFYSSYFWLNIEYTSIIDNQANIKTYFLKAVHTGGAMSKYIEETGIYIYKIHSFVVKVTPLDSSGVSRETQRKGAFKKESLFYHHLSPDFLKINQFGPHCYLVKSNCLVLEDLKARGFKTAPKFEFLSEDRCVSMLKTLGKFHACTLIFEKKNGQKIGETFPDLAKDICFPFIESHSRHKWVVNVTNCIFDFIKASNPDGELGAKFKNLVFEKLSKMLAPSEKYANVLSTCDVWVNNLMFNDQSECLMVDYQFSRYVPPALNFLEAVVLTLDPRPLNLAKLDNKSMETNFKNLVDVYYSSLEDELKKYGCQDAVTKKEFLQSLEEYKVAALVEGAMMASQMFVPDVFFEKLKQNPDKHHEFVFVNRSKYVFQLFQDDVIYRDRVNPILITLIEALGENK